MAYRKNDLQATTPTTGDLSGTYGATTVAKLNGVAVTGTAAAGQAVVATSSTAATWTAVPGATANTFSGTQTAPAFTASGLSGATATSRYAGATASGAPASGTFALGDYVLDQTGLIWVCITAGTPGTWINIAAPASITAYRPQRVESGAYAVTGIGNTTTATFTANQVFYAQVDIAASQTFTGIGTNINAVGVGGTSPSIHLGLYADDGTGSRPTGAPIANTEVTLDPTTTTGDRYVAWASPLTFRATRLWMAWELISGTALSTNATIVSLNPGALIGLGTLGNNSHRGWSSGPWGGATALPTSSTGIFRTSGNWPIIGLKAQ